MLVKLQLQASDMASSLKVNMSCIICQVDTLYHQSHSKAKISLGVNDFKQIWCKLLNNFIVRSIFIICLKTCNYTFSPFLSFTLSCPCCFYGNDNWTKRFYDEIPQKWTISWFFRFFYPNEHCKVINFGYGEK